MKTYLIKLITCAICLSIWCSNANAQSKENFDKFIIKFEKDNLFQRERILFPLLDIVDGNYGDPAGRGPDAPAMDTTWHKEWNERIYHFPADETAVAKGDTTAIGSWSSSEGAAAAEYYFELREGKWYLVKRLVFPGC